MKKLYRSKTDKKIEGVCGGIGAYLEVDSTAVRAVWAVVTLFTAGVGILGYLACMLIIPIEPDYIEPDETV